MAAALIAVPAAAQEKPDGMPQDIADLLREIGPVIEVARTGAAYAELHPSEPYEGVLVYRDLQYGPHERHVLDVFASPENEGGRPVLVFVHGGGFTGGSKRGPNSFYYDNISRWAADHGMVGVQINHRLAPEHQYPAGVEDLDRVVHWMRENIGVYGGDAEKVVLFGHSAGASHVADYVAARGQDAQPVAGAVLMSGGAYDIGSGASFRAAYYGEDESRYAEMSPLPGLVATDIPLLIVDGELDTPDAIAQTALLTDALHAAAKPVNHVRLPNHSHLSEAFAIGTADNSLTDPLRAFVAGAAAAR